MGVCSAIINFNDGACRTLNVFKNTNIEPGYFTAMYCNEKDGKPIVAMNTKSNTESKARRKKLRAIRKNHIDENKNKEGVFYEAGAFDKAVSL